MSESDRPGPAILREALRSLDIRVADFAGSVRASPATVYRWMNGEGVPSPKQRERIFDETRGAVPMDLWMSREEVATSAAHAMSQYERDERRSARRRARDDRRGEKLARDALGSRAPDLGFEIRILPSPSRPIPFYPNAFPIGAVLAGPDLLRLVARESPYRNASGEVCVVTAEEREMLTRRDTAFAAAHSLALPPRPIDEKPFTPPRDEKRALRMHAPEFGRIIRYGSSLGPVWVTPEEAWLLALRDARAFHRAPAAGR